MDLPGQEEGAYFSNSQHHTKCLSLVPLVWQTLRKEGAVVEILYLSLFLHLKDTFVKIICVR